MIRRHSTSSRSLLPRPLADELPAGAPAWVTEAEFDRQVLAVFDRMRIDDDEIREWFRTVLVSQTNDAQQESLAQCAELQCQVSLTIGQQDRPLDMRLANEVDAELFAKKQVDLRDCLANLKLQLDALDRSHDETADLAAKVF